MHSRTEGEYPQVVYEQARCSSENNRETGRYGQNEPRLNCFGERIIVGPVKEDIQTGNVTRDNWETAQLHADQQKN
jgi:hypothetical protein